MTVGRHNGKISVAASSATETVQLNESEMFYSFWDIGNDGNKGGIGVNLGDWYSINVYGTSNRGIGFSWQLTPWLTHSWECNWPNGISLSWGLIKDNVTNEISVTISSVLLVTLALGLMLPAVGVAVPLLL